MKIFFKNKISIFTGLTLILAGIFFFFSHKKAKTELTIFQTTDIHGSMIDNNSFAKTLKKEISKAGGPNNCILIDCGDTFQGSYKASISKGITIPPILNQLHYNIFVPGNHDFDFGKNIFNKNIKKLNCDVIAANLKIKSPSRQILKWKNYLKDGKKIAIIGMTSPYLDFWLWGNRYNGIKVFPIKKTLYQIMPEIVASNPDVIILAAHQGLYQSKRYPTGSDLKDIARTFPQIDIILGGHSHQIESGKILGNNTIYVQSGSHGKYLSKITIKFVNNKKYIYSKLIRVNSKYNKFPATTNSIKYSKLSKKQINYLSKLNQNEITEYFVKTISKIMKKMTNSNISFYSSRKIKLNNLGASIDQIAFKVIPYEDNIVKLNVTGEQLKKIIEEQLNYNKKNIIIFSGASILYNKKGKLGNITIANGRKLNPDKHYSIAITSYDLASAGKRYPILKKYSKLKASKSMDTGMLLRNKLIKYLENDNI